MCQAGSKGFDRLGGGLEYIPTETYCAQLHAITFANSRMDLTMAGLLLREV